MHSSLRRLPHGLALCALVSSLAAGDRLYTVSPADNNLRLVNPFTATTITTIPITATGTVLAANGLAVHPGTGELWSILQIQGSGRVLAKLNPTTGAATVIGSTGRNFAGIAFDAGGTLYGVTGDGDPTAPETLFTISLSNGASTQVTPLGNGNDGETIAFDPGTGLLLHASGLGIPNTDEIFETVNPSTLAVTNVPLSGGDYDEALGLTHWVGRNFLLSDLNDDLWLVNDGGVVSMIGTLDHTAKGLAFVQTTNGASFSPYGGGCAAAGGYIPLLAGVGTPAPGSGVTVDVINGPGGAPGGLALGLGSGSFPLRPGCLVQILPLANVILPLALGGSGAGTGTASVPLQIPSSLRGDIYFQAVLVDNTTLVLSNAERMHVQ